MPFGHCHPEISAAAKAQLDRLWHTSNVFYTEPQVTLAELLTSLSGLDRAFFCNSGAEANEALLKLARKAQHARGQPGRFEFVCFENSFHGRTLATVTATGVSRTDGTSFFWLLVVAAGASGVWPLASAMA